MISIRTKPHPRIRLPLPDRSAKSLVSAKFYIEEGQIEEMLFRWESGRNTAEIGRVMHIPEWRVDRILHAYRDLRRARS